MSKWTDKQIVVGSVLFFAFIYVTVHTDAIGDFFDVLRPFINGFILAYLTGIIAARVEKIIPLKFARGLSIVVVYLLIAGLLTLLSVYLVPILVQNIQLFVRMLPVYLEQVNMINLDQLLGSFSIADLTPRITGQLLNVTGYARAATSGVVNGVLAFVVSIYVLLTKDAIFNFTYRLSKLLLPNYTEDLCRYVRKSHTVFQQFLVAQLFASLILGIVAGVVLAILGVNYALLIGTIIGLSNIIPLVGAIIGVIVSVIIMFLTNQTMLAWVGFAFLLLLQQVDATIITPKLMGNALNLNPIIIILVLAVGTSYFGFVGILFAVPVTVMIREVATERLR